MNKKLPELHQTSDSDVAVESKNKISTYIFYTTVPRMTIFT
nr:hypothetical protein [Okeania sp. SIO2F4]